jgi:hypothetical protein
MYIGRLYVDDMSKPLKSLESRRVWLTDLLSLGYCPFITSDVMSPIFSRFVPTFASGYWWWHRSAAEGTAGV